ncbi:MAG: hypothetical protein V4669_13545 [Pseudomonadota bacterium]
MTTAALIQRILDALARAQLEQRNLGMVNTMKGLEMAYVIVAKVAQEGEPSIDCTGK